MMDTFMFGGDRFSDEEDYGETYRSLGGRNLADSQVRFVISEAFSRMEADYANPAYAECFPSVRHYLSALFEEAQLPNGEIDLLDEVFAVHETGKIPASHVEIVRQLHRTHRLGVVSNIWCHSRLCFDEFRRAGVADLFEQVVFSSDVGIIKPSPAIFQKAIEYFGEDKSSVVFVGDDIKYDVAGAKKAGLATVWIDKKTSKKIESMPSPDLVIEDLTDLLQH